MIKEIKFSNEGMVNCKGRFYTSRDIIQNHMQFNFSSGTNKLIGDIDSGIWGVSYLFSMYGIANIKDQHFSKPLLPIVDGRETHISELSKRCCYLDEVEYPLFSSKRKSVKKLIEIGLKKSQHEQSLEKICKTFLLDDERLEKPVYCVGNERFRAMAAIGYAHGKEIFCFPWLSQKTLNYYGNNINWLLKSLEELNTIVILPVGK